MNNKWLQLGLGLILTITLYLGVAAGAQPGEDGIQWMSYSEGRHLGQTQNKKIFLVFNADWCRYCARMEKETFHNPTVIAFVNRNFVPISVNSDRQQDIAAKYDVRGLPNTWFLSENGDKIGGRPGFIPADEMLKILKYISSDSYRSMSFKDFVNKQEQ